MSIDNKDQNNINNCKRYIKFQKLKGQNGDHLNLRQTLVQLWI